MTDTHGSGHVDMPRPVLDEVAESKLRELIHDGIVSGFGDELDDLYFSRLRARCTRATTVKHPTSATRMRSDEVGLDH